jgi:hypothetical protein
MLKSPPTGGSSRLQSLTPPLISQGVENLPSLLAQRGASVYFHGDVTPMLP